MSHASAEILKRLQVKGTTALEILPVYRDPAHAALWRQDSRLHRAFARKLIHEGHPTRGFEIAREGLAAHPNDQILKYLIALALAGGGNMLGARTFLGELLQVPDLEPGLRVELLSLEGRLFKDRYERTRDPVKKSELAAQSAASYRNAASLPEADSFPRINAATMTLLAGDAKQARQFASSVLEQAQRELRQHDRTDDYWVLASLGEASFILGEIDEAASWYRQAVTRASERNDVGSIASMRRNALLLKEKLDVSEEFLRLFYVGSVVVFSGHMIDHPVREAHENRPPRFPPDPRLIREVSGAISTGLVELNATVGFCSAACGADILFAEQMLQRYAELHVVLPFARNDFCATSVDFNSPAMKIWRTRFDAVLEQATQVHYATTEPFLGDEVLFDFVNSFTQGLAAIRAAERGVVPQALVVFDRSASTQPGGTGFFLESWTNAGYPAHTIDLCEINERILGEKESLPSSEQAARPADARGTVARQIKSMLFADVKDFSKLQEEYSPRFFLRFLSEVDEVLRSLKVPPTFSNTWGDGLYLVFDDVTDCAETALRLLERAEQVDWREVGLGQTTPVRIGIHTGPVFSGFDPVIGRKNYFGTHVNRAARIEPVTVPGCAFASEQFAASLAVKAGHDFVCEYVGIEQLAKQYDRCPLYRLARR